MNEGWSGGILPAGGQRKACRWCQWLMEGTEPYMTQILFITITAEKCRLFIDLPRASQARQDCCRRKNVRNRAMGDSTMPRVKGQCLGEQDGAWQERGGVCS